VADAVAFAHGRLVLHRDLKPGNILVMATGQVRLLDFGIAKLMQGDQAEETALTHAGGRPLTLEYASPEQIRGEPLGTASDVYSLGVVAYELLAGERPHRPQRPGAAALEAAIVEEDAPLASQRTADPDLRKRLQGDIDAILNKALKRSLADRYATVDAFAQDLRLHLEGQRVLARPDTTAYRALRLARRHRWPLAASAAAALAFGLALGLGATALLLVVLLAGLGAALLLARRATRERDRALGLAERNAAGNAFIETLLTRAARGGAYTAMQLVERGERLMEGDAPGNPQHRAFVLGLIANLYTQLDQHAHALPLLERALDAARRGTDPLLRDSLAGRRALTLGWLGRTEEALAVTDALLSRPGAPAELRCEVHMHRAKLAHLTGDFPATLHHAAEALRWYRAAPHLPRRQEPVLQAELGWAALKNGRGEEAEQHYAAAAAAFDALGLSDSAAALQYGGTRALMYQELGDFRRSIALYDELVAAVQRATPDSPPSVYLQANRGYALAHHGRFDDAEAAYRESAELARQQGLALVRYNIRMLLVELEAMRQRSEAARQELTAAEAERDFETPEGGPAEFARQLAEAHLALCQGDPALAVKVFGDALMQREVACGTANALLGRAAAHEAAGAWELAEADAHDALEVAEKLRGPRPSSARSGLAWLALARLHARRGDTVSAQQDARAALPHLRAQLDARHPALADAQRLAAPTAGPV
jgi:serine/threonine-protein kinase